MFSLDNIPCESNPDVKEEGTTEDQVTDVNDTVTKLYEVVCTIYAETVTIYVPNFFRCVLLNPSCLN